MPRTVKQVIDAIVADVPGAPFAETVDTLKIGNPEQTVNGIAVTFLASYDVIQKAIRQGANLIIAHEPLYYNHLDEQEGLGEDSVYTAKKQLLQENGIAVWRFHDYLHSLKPDPTTTGILKALNWSEYAEAAQPLVCTIPPRTLRTLVNELKAALGLTAVRVVGDLEMECRKVGIMVGAPPGKWHIRTLGRANVDVLLCGEINEWETSEYVRDAMTLGQHKALVVFGHAPSEEPGIREVVAWLEARLPEEKITYIATGNPLVTV